MRTLVLVSLMVVCVIESKPVSGSAWEIEPNVVFSVQDGVGLVMDILRPKDASNGLGLIVVYSGGWNCGQAVYDALLRAKVFDIFCGRGYTVFLVRPGARPRYTGQEMVDNLKTGIRWAGLHSSEYLADPDRLGLLGISSGGHLALMAAVTVADGSPEAEDPLLRQSSGAKAVGVICPPTSIVDWNGEPDGYKKLPDLLSRGGLENLSEEEMKKRAEGISPRLHVNGSMAPILLIHGDADPLVPLSQSEKMVETVRKAGGDIELIVKKGGGHSWPTIDEEVDVMADWFDKKLSK